MGQALLRNSLKLGIRLFLKPVLSSWTPIALQRGWSRAIAATTLPPRGTRSATVQMNDVPAMKITVSEPGTNIVLYLHGGGYCIGSPGSHRALAAHIAGAANATAYLPDYRLAPEHPHPAAVEDAMAAYRWLLAQKHSPSQIAIAGDSAGGGLALALALAIRSAGMPQPAALVLISPWTDLTLSGESIQSRKGRDPMLSPGVGDLWSRLYLGTHAAEEPLCSPLFSNLTSLPPMLIQVGSEEILFDDARRLGERAQAAGVPVTLHEYQGMWHEFQVHAGMLRDADAAISEIGAFVNAQLR